MDGKQDRWSMRTVHNKWRRHNQAIGVALYPLRG